ncbi:MAG: putative flavoprotein YhiN [Flavobacteriales bacterium]
MKLSSAQLELLKNNSSKEVFIDLRLLAKNIKKLKLTIYSMAPLEEGISCVGGIALGEVTDTFELSKIPDHYCIGEMLDWDAPTGGYLLQACFSMGVSVARKLNLKN